MLRIFRNLDILKNLCMRNIRKYSKNKGPFYDCPHQQEKIKEARRREEKREPTHSFLVEKDHSNKDILCRRLFFFVCLPSIVAAFINAFYIRPKPKRPPFIPYRHLRIRTKDFPWGDGNHTLFHNPRFNALPDGYETDEEEDD